MVLNWPNRLTLLRLLLTPVVLFFLFTQVKYGNFIAALVFIVAALTDTIDGYIARKWRMTTKFGALLDPVVDKILVTAVLISLIEVAHLPSWIVVIIVSREFLVTGIRLICATEGLVIKASSLGKLKTLFQIIGIVSVILNLPYAMAIMGIAVAITVISGWDYLVKAWDVISK